MNTMVDEIKDDEKQYEDDVDCTRGWYGRAQLERI